MVDTEWLKASLRKSGKTTVDLAAAIGRDRAVVSRIMNGKQEPSIQQAKTFAALLDLPVGEVLTKLDLADPATAEHFNHGFSESDAAAWTGQQGEKRRTESVAAALGAERAGIDIWTVKSPALAHMGYMPGDFMLVDTHAAESCKRGDVVIAQIYDWSTGGATTALRRFEPPALVAASPNPEDYRINLVDGTNVVIRGKVIASWRLP